MRNADKNNLQPQLGLEATQWESTCPAAKILELIGSKWVLLIIPRLRQGPKRNSELLRSFSGLSQKMLTQTLRKLEQFKLIERHDYLEKPLKVEYSLTQLGKSLAEVLAPLDDWVLSHHDEVWPAK